MYEAGYDITIIAKCEKDLIIDNGIKIIGVPKYKSRLKRFMLQPWFLIKTLKIKADIYHLHNPDTLIIGFVLKLLRNKVVYDSHEDFSKRILMRTWIPKIFRKLFASVISTLEKLAGQTFDACIVTQESVQKRIGGNTYIIENAPIINGDLIEKAYKLSNKIHKKNDVIRIIYVGGISKDRGIIEVTKILNEVNKYMRVRLWLIGFSKADNVLDILKDSPGWKYVDYLGFLPQEEAFAHIIKSDIGLSTILDVGDHSQTSPNKLYEYLTFSIPFIASNFNRWREKFEGVNAGLFINPRDVQQLFKSIYYLGNNKEIAKKMGKEGYDFILEKYNWNLESKKLLKIYKEL